MNKILILGANGQLGHDLCNVFTKNNLCYTGLTSNDFNVLLDDIQDKLLLYQSRISIIINCIATTNVDWCEDNPDTAFLVNSSFVSKLAKFCKLNDIILFHISTDYVFAGDKTTPYTESDTPNPLNIYGFSKKIGDNVIQIYHDKFFILRVSSLFGRAGATGKGGNFITTMQKLGSTRDFVSVIVDQITCPTATLDVARCISYLIINKIDNYGIYNCVSSNSCSWFEFAQSIFSLSGLDNNKIHQSLFDNYHFKANRPKYSVLSINKLSQYYKMSTWQESLKEYFAK